MSAGLVLTFVAAALLMALYRRDKLGKKRQRANLFSRCLPLFETYRVVQDDVAYPVLSGTYRGADVRLEAIVDTMSWRKLPILYLSVTVVAQTAYRGAVDYLARPSGFEVFSQASHLAHRLSIPSDWPQEAILATDDPRNLPSLNAISAHITKFEGRDLKELVVTPRGVRLVRKIEECSRAHYAAFREITFTTNELDFGIVCETLDAALELYRSVAPVAPTAKVA